jgi:cation diffusion facilitator CzcD-associated flavoprotein CzcO
VCVERAPRGFQLVLEDGEPVQARRVVIATGIAPFAWRPPQFNALPRSLASHSSEHRNLQCFAGQRMLVVGGGQSALESAALLHEAGAEVEVVARAPRIHWLHRSAWLHSRGRLLRLLLYAPTDVGPAGLSWVVALPDVFRCVPHQLQRPIARRCLRPAGAAWLLPRLSGVPITTGRTVVTATLAGARLRLRFDDGSERCVDHVLLATGYRVDVTRQTFLAPGLVRSLQRTGGYPTLAAGFQSSVPGLHFLGAPAAASFGPLMRFVAGTGYAARALTRHVVDHRQG